jgi:integrase/recombinase XerD
MSKRLPHLVQDDAPERLAEAARTERDRLIVLVLIYCGLRNAELRGLQVPDLDLRRRMLKVNLGKGAKDRVVPIPQFLARPLRGFIGARRKGPLFLSRNHGRGLSARGLQLLIKTLAVRAGLPDPTSQRNYFPHALRHVYACRLLRTGADITEVKALLGHSSVLTTMIYTSVDPVRLAAAVDRLAEGE